LLDACVHRSKISCALSVRFLSLAVLEVAVEVVFVRENTRFVVGFRDGLVTDVGCAGGVEEVDVFSRGLLALTKAEDECFCSGSVEAGGVVDYNIVIAGCLGESFRVV